MRCRITLRRRRHFRNSSLGRALPSFEGQGTHSR
jgi:hypothetical protein